MPLTISPRPPDWTMTPRTPTPAKRLPARAVAAARATVAVAEPPHLCGVQSTTREVCRALGADESVVFQAVIAVTELAHGLFTARARSGSLELAATRRKGGLSLEIVAAADDLAEPIRFVLTYPRAAAPYS